MTPEEQQSLQQLSETAEIARSNYIQNPSQELFDIFFQSLDGFHKAQKRIERDQKQEDTANVPLTSEEQQSLQQLSEVAEIARSNYIQNPSQELFDMFFQSLDDFHKAQKRIQKIHNIGGTNVKQQGDTGMGL